MSIALPPRSMGTVLLLTVGRVCADAMTNDEVSHRVEVPAFAHASRLRAFTLEVERIY